MVDMTSFLTSSLYGLGTYPKADRKNLEYVSGGRSFKISLWS
jgi:hypothetical protein